jgi:hypothetical protein
MPRQTRDELEAENTRLRESLTLLELFVSDLFAGRAATQTRGRIQWAISRPGSPSGGVVIIRDTITNNWSAHTICDAVKLSRDLCLQNSYEGGGWAHCNSLGIEASRIQEAACSRSVTFNTTENRIGLAVDLLGFRPIKLTTKRPTRDEEV